MVCYVSIVFNQSYDIKCYNQDAKLIDIVGVDKSYVFKNLVITDMQIICVSNMFSSTFFTI